MKIYGLIDAKMKQLVEKFPEIITETDVEMGNIITIPECNIVASFETKYGQMTFWKPSLIGDTPSVTITSDEFYKIEII